MPDIGASRRGVSTMQAFEVGLDAVLAKWPIAAIGLTRLPRLPALDATFIPPLDLGHLARMALGLQYPVRDIQAPY